MCMLFPLNDTGTYFGTHFIMGGERFDTPQPEAYLFGENGDLNFLGSRPTAVSIVCHIKYDAIRSIVIVFKITIRFVRFQFPYPPPQANEPTKTLKSLINIRKESVRFVRVADPNKINNDSNVDTSHLYNIEFVFDADTKCAIQIFYFCTEEITSSGLT